MNNNFALSGVAGHVLRHLRARKSDDLSRFRPLTFPTVETTDAKERATEEAVFHRVFPTSNRNAAANMY